MIFLCQCVSHSAAAVAAASDPGWPGADGPAVMSQSLFTVRLRPNEMIESLRVGEKERLERLGERETRREGETRRE